ncbi:hypothetical protein Pse7429DRAFT_3470 [Pseudanabaena biceps PCC 7429]|uniref:Uncharacterized protein n=1 Tax=Pseudanabaena biceps PCC 7429 TaxID=927668 RepID=L8MXB2_9CYAN|nr:hypothetical protein Pse7429DRAFT_3470 [Pseudanabaena biceps PCC 7429]
MTQAIEQKSTLYDRDLNLWLEEANMPDKSAISFLTFLHFNVPKMIR